VLTVYGVLALSFMLLRYALEGRGKIFTLGFPAGCGLSSIYGFLADAWPFGIVEFGWAGAALRRYQRRSGIEREPTADARRPARPRSFPWDSFP
jgi:hypothetical protein